MARSIDLGSATLRRVVDGRGLACFIFQVIETPRHILRDHCSV
jgi:hypothetical protein